MTSLPQNRVLLYIFIFSLFPLALALFRHTSQVGQLNELEAKVNYLQQAAIQRERKQASNLNTRLFFQGADRFYIDKQVESLPLLENESESLIKLANRKEIAEDPRINRRLSTLNNNTLIFSEGMVQTFPFFNEIPEALAHSVEVDLNDLKKILAKIEGVKIGAFEPGPHRPQLIITDFRLDRKTAPEESDLYNLNLKLIKREYF